MFEHYSNRSIASTSLGDGAQWFDQLLHGRLGITIAVLAVGLAGLRTLLGFMNPREMARILFGCFVLFGATAIARAIIGAPQYAPLPAGSDMITGSPDIPATPLAAATQIPPATVNPFDPYVGSAIVR